MNLTIEPSELRPLVQSIVTEVVRDLAATGPLGDGRLAYREPEAAELLGVTAAALRDARLRGELTATKVGGRIGYERSELLAYLASWTHEAIEKPAAGWRASDRGLREYR